MRFRRWPSVLAVVFVLAVFPALAADGAIPIWEPTTITESGRYRLVRNVTDNSPNPVITIAADNVDLDLNGFTVNQLASGGVGVQAEQVKLVSIHDGFVRVEYSSHGIIFRTVSRFTIRRVTLSAVGNRAGILLDDCGGGVVEDNLIYSAEPAILLTDAHDISIHRNKLVYNDGAIQGSCTDCEIAGNLSSSYDQIEIGQCANCRIRDNTFGSVWISSGDRNLIDNNVCARLQLGGSDSFIRNNNVSDGWGAIIAGDRNQIEGNTFNGSFGHGLLIEGNDNVYRGNTARGNSGSSCSNPSGTADFCDEGTNNTSHGDNYMPGQM